MPAVFVKFPVPVYGAVPPLAETVTFVEPPLQSIAVAEEDAVTALTVSVAAFEVLTGEQAPFTTH